ncbi:hypothetical protein CF134_20000 [Aeromonas salmonicida]|nr:hypothetical protein CF134_20000 [Aeromonas salmonicida]
MACMSCPNISSMWLRISSWLNMGIVCWVLAGQGWRSYLRSRATPRSYEGMVKIAEVIRQLTSNGEETVASSASMQKTYDRLREIVGHFRLA